MTPDMNDNVIAALVPLATPDNVTSIVIDKLPTVGQLACKIHQPCSVNPLSRMACSIALGPESEFGQLNPNVCVKNWGWVWFDLGEVIALGPDLS